MVIFCLNMIAACDNEMLSCQLLVAIHEKKNRYRAKTKVEQVVGTNWILGVLKLNITLLFKQT